MEQSENDQKALDALRSLQKHGVTETTETIKAWQREFGLSDTVAMRLHWEAILLGAIRDVRAGIESGMSVQEARATSLAALDKAYIEMERTWK